MLERKINKFIENPLKVVIFGYKEPHIPRKTYVYLGDITPNLQKMVQTQNGKLRDFYGKKYKEKLAIDYDEINYGVYYEGADEPEENEPEMDSLLMAAHRDIRDKNIIDKSIDDDIELLLGDRKKETKVKAKSLIERGTEYVTNVYVYPEDRIMDLKEKIFVTTGIPVYRQHLFYVKNGAIDTSYKIYAGGLQQINITKYGADQHNILGIYVDKYLYDMRDEIRIEARDTFTLIDEITSPETNNTVYVADLDEYLSPIRAQLLGNIKDTYNFELIYYGFIAKFWPQLTKECFHDYVLDENDLANKYPELAKSVNNLATTYAAEAEIINRVYSNDVAARFKKGEITTAIVSVVAFITSQRVHVNIRNLFDRLQCSQDMPEIHAHVEHNGRFLLRKKYITAGDLQFPSGALMRNGITIAVKNIDTAKFAEKLGSKEGGEINYFYLNIWPNGKYYVRAHWNEEDEFDFNDVAENIKIVIGPIIAKINSFGGYVMDGQLSPISKSEIKYYSINACVFWKNVMLESSFRALKFVWDKYIRAKIALPRNLQQTDKFEVLFRKGMHKFDPRNIERIMSASSGTILTNFYIYLSNNTVKQKWDQTYEGRLLRMIHKTTAVKFEIIDIKEDEFSIFLPYIVDFVNNAEISLKKLPSESSNSNVKRLRKLKEQDPKLFKIEKHGGKKLYSILCQNLRQPLVYTQDELAKMSQADIKKLTKYWNFTLNKPAYYGCPNKNYPHLSFTVDAHPQHYCLPCCSKEPTGEESKKAKIVENCLAEHQYRDIEGASRHIIGYGKEIPIDRLSKIPQTVKTMLYGSLAPNMDYYIYGVAQNVHNLENVGMLFSIAAIMGKKPQDVASAIINGLKQRKESSIWNMLLGGKMITYFPSLGDFLTKMNDIFVLGRDTLIKTQFIDWSDLFMELAHLLFNLHIVTIIDTGTGMSLFVPDYVSGAIVRHETINLGLTLRRKNTINPIIVADPTVYMRNLEIESRNFDQDSKTAAILRKMIQREYAVEHKKIGKTIDLTLLGDFVGKNSEYKIITKYNNKSNFTYAVLIECPSGPIYMPIDYTTSSDKIPISFDQPPIDKLKEETLMVLVGKINNLIDSSYKFGNIATYEKIIPEHYITIGGRKCGFRSGILTYRFAPGENMGKGAGEIMYELTDVNSTIMKDLPAVENNGDRILAPTLYSNYLYQLFVVEFVSHLKKERNVSLRAKIDKILTGKLRTDIAEINKKIGLLLEDNKNDKEIILGAISDFYHAGKDTTDVKKYINDTIFEFDHITLNQLKDSSIDNVREKVSALSSQFCIERDIANNWSVKGSEFPNIYLPCSECGDSCPKYCTGKKLIVRDLAKLVDLLAHDILNGLKNKYFTSALMSDNYIDYFRFTNYPTEIITIYKL